MKNITFGTPIKNLQRGPGYRLVNAVVLSLQSSHNTQLRTCIILVIYLAAFGTPLMQSIPTQKKRQYFDITLFEELCFQNIVIRNHYFLLFLLVQGQASQEILLVREVLCMSRTSQAWHLHTTACHQFIEKNELS